MVSWSAVLGVAALGASIVAIVGETRARRAMGEVRPGPRVHAPVPQTPAPVMVPVRTVRVTPAPALGPRRYPVVRGLRPGW